MQHDDRARGFDRREFLIGSASLAIAASAGIACSEESSRRDARPDLSRDAAVERPRDGATSDGPVCSASQPLPAPTTPARVVEVKDPTSVDVNGNINATRVGLMLGAGLMKLANETEIKKAWQVLLPDFTTSMRIGIKLNCLSSSLYNSLPLVAALVKTLVGDLGADASKIIVWDRRSDELSRSQLTDAAVGAKVLGTIKKPSDTSGPGYETQSQCVLTKETHLSRILTEQTDITINIPLLKTHTVSGITGALKNTYGCIDNPGDFHTGLIQELPVIYRLDGIRKRMRLHITEALLAVLQGSTEDPPDATPGRLLLSLDPVALDTHALSVANTLRGAGKEVDAAKVKWIDEAAKLNLGTKTVDPQVFTLT
jgi:hypothetical protein